MSLDNLDSSENLSEKVYSVEQLNSHIRSLIEGQIPTVWLQGEISNFKPHSSGHFYFSIKDPKAQISAVMFRGHNLKLKFKPHDGLEVLVRGRITVYEPRGSYQIACEAMEPVGAGALQKQFEQLKLKLNNEGLFESSRKKAIPAYPKTVAVVTSPTGAAIQDILNIMNRRAKNVEVIVVPALVQGAAAAPSLRQAFENALKVKPDVIIIGRGGGSIEDMWCFNDEDLARLIAASTIPVISAVGHEIDFTICDFVADLRAPTPSAAAELVSKSSLEVVQKIETLTRNLNLFLKKNFEIKKQKIILNTKRLVDPKKRLQDLFMKNDDLMNRLEGAMQRNLEHFKKDILLLRSRLTRPDQLIGYLRSQLDKQDLILKSSVQNQLSRAQNKTNQLMSILDSLSPMKVVDRGYSILSDDKNKIIKSIKQIKIKDKLTVKINDGAIDVEVLKINNKE